MLPVMLPFAIAAGANIVGGAAGLAMSNRIRAPKSLQQQIDKVSSPNYYLPMLQRVYNSAQGDATIQRSLARQGQGDNEYLQREMLEANQARSGEAVKEGMQSMEGQRLSMLERLTAQKTGFDMARQQARISAVNQMIGGFGSALTAGAQAGLQNQQFNAGMEQQNMFWNGQRTMWQDFMKAQLGGGLQGAPQLPMGGMPQGNTYRSFVPQGMSGPTYNPITGEFE